jgi:hypothetical protein
MTMARPPDVNQSNSQHGAMQAKKKSIAGIYSMDISGVNGTADRGLLSRYIESGNDSLDGFFRR